jgi:hypothetical protein
VLQAKKKGGIFRTSCFKNNASTQIQQHNISFLAGDSIIFFSAAKFNSFLFS